MSEKIWIPINKKKVNIFEILELFDKYFQKCQNNAKQLLRNAMGGGLVGPYGDPRV